MGRRQEIWRGKGRKKEKENRKKTNVSILRDKQGMQRDTLKKRGKREAQRRLEADKEEDAEPTEESWIKREGQYWTK